MKVTGVGARFRKELRAAKKPAAAVSPVQKGKATEKYPEEGIIIIRVFAAHLE